jgi:hypothetical protein
MGYDVLRLPETLGWFALTRQGREFPERCPALDASLSPQRLWQASSEHKQIDCSISKWAISTKEGRETCGQDICSGKPLVRNLAQIMHPGPMSG